MTKSIKTDHSRTDFQAVLDFVDRLSAEPIGVYGDNETFGGRGLGWGTLGGRGLGWGLKKVYGNDAWEAALSVEEGNLVENGNWIGGETPYLAIRNATLVESKGFKDAVENLAGRIENRDQRATCRSILKALRNVLRATPGPQRLPKECR